MKKILLLSLLTFIAVIAWRMGERMSSDAISMGLGVLLGVLAGVPTALLLLISNRGRRTDGEAAARGGGQYSQYPALAAQPPVIVVTGAGGAPQALSQPSRGASPTQQTADGWDHAPTQRQFKVVGEREEWLEDW